MPGETEQEKGREGARLAKKWLDRSTRASANWVNPDKAAVKKLTLEKVVQRNGSNTFSFDLGGHLRGEEIEGQSFLAECKKYATSGDLGTHYKLFLAHCYRAVSVNHVLSDNFFWISFAPFNVTKWDVQTQPDAVRDAVRQHPDVNFPENSNVDSEICEDTIRQVSERLWVLILSEKQVQNLVLTKEHHGVIEKFIIEQEGDD